jgi:aminoglycoside phosphotransferase (APT) family kinase protein
MPEQLYLGGELSPLDGGYSGESFRATSPDGADLVVRVYQRQPDRAAVDASLLRLVRGIIPVPEVVEVRLATATEPAVLVTDYVPGLPMDRLLDDPPDDLDWETLGLSTGHLLGRLSGIPFVRSGAFTGPELVAEPGSLPTDLAEFAQGYRDTGRLAAWSDRDWDALLDLIDIAESMLDPGQRHPFDDRVVLVHSDFNPKNLVVDVDSSDVAAVVDWEFAYAGAPYADLGNLTRFERDPRLIEPVLDAFVAQAPALADDALDRGRASDLWALVELAGRARSNPVAELAAALLVAQARAADLDAWPFPTTRATP